MKNKKAGRGSKPQKGYTMKKHTITLSQINPSYTYSVKDNSPRGCHTAIFDDLKIGDKIVIDNYFHEIIEETPTEATETTEDTTHTTESPTETEKTPAESERLATVETLDLLDDLDTGDHGDRLNDYRDSSTYICDAIAEIADADTSIYYSDILDFIRNNPESLADVINEGLYDPRQDYDLYKHGQAAEFLTIERDIYDHLPDSLMCAAVHFIRYDLKRETIPAELADLLREWCDEADSDDRLDEIPDKIREYFDDLEAEAFDSFCAVHGCETCPFKNCATVAECRAAFEKGGATV